MADGWPERPEWTEPEPVAGEWTGVYDDAAGTVAVTGPEGYSVGRAYSDIERNRRAGQIAATAAATTAGDALTAANLAQAAADGMIRASQTDPGHMVGRIWLELDADGRVTGISVSDGTTWAPYTLMADRIVSVSPLGQVEIVDNKIMVQRDVGEADLQVTTMLGSPNATEDDTLELYSSTSGTAGVLLSGNGTVSAETVSADTVLAGGIDMGDYVAGAPSGIIAHHWASGSAIPSWGLTALGLVRFTWQHEAHRRYRINVKLHLQGTAGDAYEIVARHAAGATVPTVASGEMSPEGSARGVIGANAAVGSSNYDTHEHSFITNYGATNTYHVLLTIRTWNANREMRLMPGVQSVFWVEDLGFNTGEASATLDTAGGSPFDGGPAPAPAPQPVTRTASWNVSFFRSWRGSSQTSDELQHGTYGGLKRTSQLVFNPGTTLDGATINWARIRLRNTHTYYSAGSVIRINCTTHSSLLATPLGAGSAGAYIQRTIPQYDNNWYSLTSIFTTGTRSVWLGPDASSGLDSYAKFARYAKDCVLEVNYTK